MHYPFPSLFHGAGTHAYQILVECHYQLGHMLVFFLRIIYSLKDCVHN